MPPGFQPIVIDNGSRDGSPQLAADLGAIVVNAARRGYGSACHAGLVAATAPLVAVMDADASLDPAQLPDLIDPLARDHADLVVGVRRLAHRRAQPWTLRFANAELARRVRRRTGLPLRDIGPMRAAWREALLELKVQDRRSGYPVETVVRAADAGWRIVAVDTDYLLRKGRSKVTGTPLGAWRAVRDISTVLALRRRDRPRRHGRLGSEDRETHRALGDRDLENQLADSAKGAKRRDLLAVATALVLIATAAVGGRILLDQGRRIVLPAPPLLAHWAPHLGWGTPLTVLCALVGLRLQQTAAALTWRRLLLAGWLLNLAWMCSLTLVDGLQRDRWTCCWTRTSTCTICPGSATQAVSSLLSRTSSRSDLEWTAP